MEINFKHPIKIAKREGTTNAVLYGVMEVGTHLSKRGKPIFYYMFAFLTEDGFTQYARLPYFVLNKLFDAIDFDMDKDKMGVFLKKAPMVTLIYNDNGYITDFAPVPESVNLNVTIPETFVKTIDEIVTGLKSGIAFPNYVKRFVEQSEEYNEEYEEEYEKSKKGMERESSGSEEVEENEPEEEKTDEEDKKDNKEESQDEEEEKEEKILSEESPENKKDINEEYNEIMGKEDEEKEVLINKIKKLVETGKLSISMEEILKSYAVSNLEDISIEELRQIGDS